MGKIVKVSLTVVFIVLATFDSTAQPTRILAATGKVTMLRAHDQGTRYGPADDSIDAEVVIWLNTHPGQSFGFQLRDNERTPSRRAMYDLLLQAYIHDWTVRIDYFQIDPTRKNHIMFRAWVNKQESKAPVKTDKLPRRILP